MEQIQSCGIRIFLLYPWEIFTLASGAAKTGEGLCYMERRSVHGRCVIWSGNEGPKWRSAGSAKIFFFTLPEINLQADNASRVHVKSSMGEDADKRWFSADCIWIYEFHPFKTVSQNRKCFCCIWFWFFFCCWSKCILLHYARKFSRHLLTKMTWRLVSAVYDFFQPKLPLDIRVKPLAGDKGKGHLIIWGNQQADLFRPEHNKTESSRTGTRTMVSSGSSNRLAGRRQVFIRGC